MTCEQHTWLKPFRATQAHGGWFLWRRCDRCGVVGLVEVDEPPEHLIDNPVPVAAFDRELRGAVSDFIKHMWSDTRQQTMDAWFKEFARYVRAHADSR